MNLKEIHYNTFSYRIRFVLIFGIMAGIIAMFAYLILLTHERNNLENHFYDIATGKIAYKNEMLDLTAKQLKDHLFALKNNDHLERYFQDPSPPKQSIGPKQFYSDAGGHAALFPNPADRQGWSGRDTYRPG